MFRLLNILLALYLLAQQRSAGVVLLLLGKLVNFFLNSVPKIRISNLPDEIIYRSHSIVSLTVKLFFFDDFHQVTNITMKHLAQSKHYLHLYRLILV